ncbi:sugar phosphate isomerase/epimerase (plasmid) [Glaciihabitans sp. INWT7]|uniref:sugar phosphate isomerase/epimerase family protein n=1 Tax=Glaciihabitans sp. INWT7 TaxID=2596912 RepID=UPI00162891E7|nr:sugar phosphate isomerase/epimerase family protein [Glaciihabitans sp. INWT7]QNE48627.1 sugar phosphate isomerase/epimerase [Glaciihabitans sp. INWT7]
MSLARFSLNQATIKCADLPTAVRATVDAGIPAIGLWREPVAEFGLTASAAAVRDAGLRVSSLCRGGFFTVPEGRARRAASDDNRRALDEAAVLGAPTLVLVAGGLPEGSRDLVGARSRVVEALGELAPHARQVGVTLAIEALHPMYVSDRAVVSTLGQALDLAAPFTPEEVGVVVDTFHVWWDPALREQIARAGRERRIASYQVCDWMMPIASDPLLSRGIPGDGCIDFATITEWVRAAGYRRDVECEIFRQEIWDADAFEVANRVADAYERLIAEHV